jgi:hypothetical protein
MRKATGSLLGRVLVVALLVTLASCGSALKRDAKRLKNKCDVVQGNEVTEEQARCIAKIYGLEETKNCPLEIDRSDDFGAPAYRVRESCSGVGVFVAESTGRVLAILPGVD